MGSSPPIRPSSPLKEHSNVEAEDRQQSHTKRSISTTVKHTTLRKAKKDAKTAIKVAKIEKCLGVIDTIVDVLKAGGGTIPEIVAAVHKKVPGREPAKLTATVRAQMNRLKLSKEEGGRGLKVKKARAEGQRRFSSRCSSLRQIKRLRPLLGAFFLATLPVAVAACYASAMKKFALTFVPKPFAQQDADGLAAITRALRWWLEFARNLLVVAGFFYVAQASNILVLKIFSYINLAVLAGTIFFFFQSWHFQFVPHPYVVVYRHLRWINYGLGFFIQMVLLMGALFAFMELVDAFKAIAKVTL
jgi:hypothetical protein